MKRIKKLAVLGMVSASLLGGYTALASSSNATKVQATSYKYTKKFYKVKLLKKTEVDKSKRSYISISDVYNSWKYLPAGTIVYVKSNGDKVSWQVKGPQLKGKYWVTNYNTEDYSWFTTNLKAKLPFTSYNRHGIVVRQTPNTISYSNKYAKVTIYTNTIKLYHFNNTENAPYNTAYIKVKFTNKSKHARVAADFIDDYFKIRKLNSKTLSSFEAGISTQHAPNSQMWKQVQRGKQPVRPHKTITALIANDLHGGLHSHQKFMFQPIDDWDSSLGKPKYAKGSVLHQADDYTETDDFIDDDEY